MAPAQTATGVAISAELEPPGRHEREPVVDPSVTRHRERLGECPREHPASFGCRVVRLPIRLRETVSPLIHDSHARGPGLGNELVHIRLHGVTAAQGDIELGNAELVEAVVEVEAGSVVWADSDHARGARDPVTQECGARERVRAAARHAVDAESVDAERVGDGGRVGRSRSDVAAR